ncbi:MAG TPA: ribosome biogenesis GTPase Der [Candidatus Kapabacteria bacterium]|nr:ribosome biogenesis GTPase Der [Candidatus Kapabacteria bacterium]
MADAITLQDQHLSTIALVGRVNVGKSTLFNRLIEEQKAIVSDIPGTTRTNNEGIVLWRGKQIRIIDTGGLSFDESVPFETDIIKQSERATKDADLIVFVVDAQTTVLPQELELAKRLRRKGKPVLLVANKVDVTAHETAITSPEWYRLGFGAPFPVSAINGRNLGDFLDEVYKHLGKASRRPKMVKEKKETPIRVSLIGKPNVGKSSLFNKIIGEEKAIVSDIPHTTREPYDTLVTYAYDDVNGKKKKQDILFLDTAGIRRKANVSGILEQRGISKSIQSIEDSDIVLFVIDGTETISSQDMQLGGLLERKSKSVLLLVNKWDLSEDVSDTHRNDVKERVYSYFPHLKFAPILFVSGLTGYRVHQIFPAILEAWKGRQTEVPQAALDDFMTNLLKMHRPARGKGTRHPEILGMRQLRSNPPMFELYIKEKTSLHLSYVHFIENKLRELFDFYATPIVIKLTKMKK